MKSMLKFGVTAFVVALLSVSINHVSAQCSAAAEEQVSNIDQVSQWLTIESTIEVFDEDGQFVGYQQVANIAKGHKKGSSKCCNFNSGRCGKSSAMVLLTDELENIIDGNVVLWLGEDPDLGEYIRWEDNPDFEI